MADNDTPKLSTCPICGYTDTADDAEVLNMAIQEHIRMSHNLDPATLGSTGAAVKPVTDDTAAAVDGSNADGPPIPIIAASPNLGGSGPDGTGLNYGAGQALIASEAIEDTADRRAETNNVNRNDETSRF